MVAADEILYPVGVDNLYIAMMTGGKDSYASIPTYEQIVSLPNIETIGIGGDAINVTKMGFKQTFCDVIQNTQYTLTLDTPGLPVAVMDKIMGYH